ncbi:MAG: DUF2147 domain-containing protein [Ginsengibacter sp.]
MKKFYFILILVVIVALNASSQNNTDQIVGNWLIAENNMAVEIYKSHNFYEAKVIWVNDTNDKSTPVNAKCDFRNPEENLRKRKIIGLVVMNGLIYSEQNNDWEQGKIYDPHSGKNWSAKVSLTKDKLLRVHGYWGFQLLGKDILFKKILATNFLTTIK